ncbi:MAG: type I pullulanase [Saprospiraceae bacterium]|nr:MAG: type I pullulanase [Saprospiraceae bacterium]
MKQLAYPTMLILLSMACQPPAPTYQSFEEYPAYQGRDLGLVYSPEKSVFKLWAPPAEEVKLHLYTDPVEGDAESSHQMDRQENGVWMATFTDDLLGKYYAFQTKVDGKWGEEVPDPYVKAVGTNGQRGQVVDLATTNPEGWEQDQRPPLQNFTDIILYELHVRDLSMNPNSGIQHKGKFLGLTELGTRSPEGVMTGLDHIKDLGVTHVHLLPSFDFMSVDESKPEDNEFNWGYDPQNYNVPEGSYSTNPADGTVRIREFKQVVKTLHDNGLRVIMDVVYNHTGATEGSNFNQLVPGYYYRQNEEGGFSNASACGNETASERTMVRKFMVESMKYWAEEYHIDGFRVDLMGIHDIETMNRVSASLHQVDPTIFIYGEGWTAGSSPLPEAQQALKKNTPKLDQIAAFSDDIRDAIKGHVFTHDAKGFISGLPGLEESIKFGIVASTKHAQVDYSVINYSKAPWAPSPFQTITYVSCHDNHTLWDRLTISCPEASEEEKIKMHKLAGAMVLTSQGVSFLHAGVEMMRTKGGEENSFESPDEVNQIDWSRKSKYPEVYNYFKNLISLRKNHPAFRMMTTDVVQAHLKFLDVPEGSTNLVAYQLTGNANGDPWREILVVFNGNKDSKAVNIPEGEWTIVVDGKKVNEDGLGTINTTSLTIPGRTAMVLKGG